MTNWLTQVLPVLPERKTIISILARISTKKRKLDKGNHLDPSFQRFMKLEQKVLEESLRAELSRREVFQRRALAFIGSVAVMSAFTIGAMNLLKAQRLMIANWAIGLGVVATLIYLATAAQAALKVIAPREIFDLNLLTRMDGEEVVEGDAWKETLINIIQLNQAHNLILAYYSDHAYKCLRNGVFSLVLTLSVLVADALIKHGSP